MCCGVGAVLEIVLFSPQVTGYNDAIWITVHLTTSGGVPHYHSIHGPGSTKVPCKETTLPGGVPAVQVMVGPDSNMTAV